MPSLDERTGFLFSSGKVEIGGGYAALRCADDVRGTQKANMFYGNKETEFT